MTPSDAADIVRAVGKRTLYRFAEIAQMTAGEREVLVVDFRQAKVLSEPLGLDELRRHDVVTAWPQTIQSIPPKGAAWIAKRASL